MYYLAFGVVFVFANEAQIYTLFSLPPSLFTGNPGISLVSATFEVLSNGSILYSCEVTSSGPPMFMWEATERGNMRVSLSNNDPDVTITINIDVSSSSSSRLLFNPNFVRFTDPECIVSAGGAPPLRVLTSEFTGN